MIYPYYSFNDMAVDGIVMLGTRTLTTTVLTQLSGNIPVLAPSVEVIQKLSKIMVCNMNKTLF